MKREEFYKDAYPGLKLAERRLLDLLDIYRLQAEEDSDLQPVVYICSRIKKPDRMLEKLERRGYEKSLYSALHNVYDAVGVRAVCAFSEDVFRLVNWLKTRSEIEIILEKDYGGITMFDIWGFLLQTLTVSGVAALILVIKALFKDKLSPKWQFAVWSVLGIIMLLPAGMFGRYTLFRWQLMVELVKSWFGVYSFTKVLFPIPIIKSIPQTIAEWIFTAYVLGILDLMLQKGEAE